MMTLIYSTLNTVLNGLPVCLILAFQSSCYGKFVRRPISYTTVKPQNFELPRSLTKAKIVRNCTTSIKLIVNELKASPREMVLRSQQRRTRNIPRWNNRV